MIFRVALAGNPLSPSTNRTRTLLILAIVASQLPASAHAQIGNVLSSSHYPGTTPLPQAQNVYDFLTGMENNARNGIKQTIMGQHVQAHKETYVGQYYDRVDEITNGKLPGFLELDFGSGKYGSTYNEPYVQQAMNLATDAWNSGDSIIGYSFHMSVPGSPKKAFEYCFPQPQHDDAWFKRTIDKAGNTPEYQLLIQDLSFAADRLEVFKDNGIPILYRPYHEMNKLEHPFWWGNRDPDDFKQLWEITQDYLVEERGLDNLLFVWSTYEWDGRYGGEPWEYYPGDDKVDLMGVDIYEGNPYFPAKFYNDAEYLNKPRMVTENNKMPARWGDNVFPQSVSEIDARPYVIWTIWGSLLELNLDESTPNQWNVSSNNKAIRDTYNYYSYEDEMWRVLSGGPNGSFDFSYLAQAQILEGDYNGDGTIDAADYITWRNAMSVQGAVLINDATPGFVNEDDYLVWRSNFGQTLGIEAIANSQGVPEPSSIVLTFLVAAAIGARFRPIREIYCR